MLAADAVNLDELLETRMLVEIPLAGLAAQRATDEDVHRLRELVEQAAAAGEDSDRFSLDPPRPVGRFRPVRKEE